MTFKEFLKNNPADVEKAKKCKDIKEFEQLAKSAGITYKDESELQDAYNFVKGSNTLSDDALEAASGGRGRVYNEKDVYVNPTTGEMLTRGTGKKA